MSTDQDSTQHIRAFLLENYGPLVNREGLAKVLGFNNLAAFDRSVQRGRLTLKLTRIPGRRGCFALASDLADYLVKAAEEGQMNPTAKERVDQR